MRWPFTNAPAPRAAVNNSPSAGMLANPATTSPPASKPIKFDHAGLPRDEIAGAVDRIDNPSPPAARSFVRAFFAEQTVVGERALQLSGDELFAFPIGARDRRVIGLGIESQARAVVAQGDFTGLAGDGASGVQFFLKIDHSWLGREALMK